MVISPCMIKTRLSALYLGFGRAGTAAAWMPMLRAMGSSGAHVTPAGIQPRAPCTDVGFSRRGRGAKLLKTPLGPQVI